jgi:hypothetical protein
LFVELTMTTTTTVLRPISLPEVQRLRILEALVDVAPPLIDRITKPGPHCVLSTRVGQLALAVFGVAAKPFPVELSIFNDAWRQWGDEGYVGGADEQVRRGAYLLTNTPNWQGGELPSLNPASGPRPWDGHLVLRVENWLIDLDLGQMARPTKGMHLPSAIVAPLDADAVDGSFTEQTTGTTTHVAYKPLVAPYAEDYRRSKDWTRDTVEYTDVVIEIARQMRAHLHR